MRLRPWWYLGYFDAEHAKLSTIAFAAAAAVLSPRVLADPRYSRRSRWAAVLFMVSIPVGDYLNWRRLRRDEAERAAAR